MNFLALTAILLCNVSLRCIGNKFVYRIEFLWFSLVCILLVFLLLKLRMLLVQQTHSKFFPLNYHCYFLCRFFFDNFSLLICECILSKLITIHTLQTHTHTHVWHNNTIEMTKMTSLSFLLVPYLCVSAFLHQYL